MMKSLLKFLFLLSGVPLLFLGGCELSTRNPGGNAPPPGKDMVINEVFTIPPDRFYAYSWIELYNPTDHKISWLDESFPATGFAVGASGSFVQTTNDGNPWNVLQSGVSANLNSVTFAYPDTGYAVGEGGAILKIQHDVPSGVYSFSTLPTPAFAVDKNLAAVTSIPISPTVYVVGDSGLIMRSINRGASWTRATVPSRRNLRAIFFVDFNRIYAVGDSGTILKSVISNQWQQQTPALGQASVNYTSVNFVSDTGWVTGENGIIAITRNGGGTWKAETSNTAATLRAGYFSPSASGHGWVVGDSGVILNTTDGGTWTRQFSGTSGTLRSVEFVDTLRGWVFGDGGLILATTNGGSTWNPQSSGVSTRLTGGFFNPLSIHLFTTYALELWSQRKYFFVQPPFLPNYDDIVKTDTGLVIVYPPLMRALGINFGDVVAGGFAVIKSDSSRFQNHTSIGPGNTVAVNLSLGFPVNNDSIVVQRLDLVLWDLLSSGEIRLVKLKQKEDVTGRVLESSFEDVDVVRWGNFRPQPSYFVGGNTYPNNVPAGFIPEWYSLARYGNDTGGDVNLESTTYSFYLSETPIPGWYSQRKR